MPTELKFSELTPLSAYSSTSVIAIQSDPPGPPGVKGFKGNISTDVTMSDAAVNLLNTSLSIKTYVDNSILAISHWTRDLSGFLKPTNAGDDLNMLQGAIYTIDPANTSGTKSYEISQVLTGTVFAFEHASTIFTGLSQGAQKNFMVYAGASNTISFGGENWTFDNIVGTIGQVLWKTNISATGGSGFFFNEIFGRNDAAGEVIYYQDRCIISDNTAGSEDGIRVFDVMENGIFQTEYMRLDGGNAKISTTRPLEVAGSITSNIPGTDGILSLNNASSVETVKLDTNGISFFAGGDVEIKGNELFLDNAQAINFANAADSASATIKMLAGDTLDIRAPAAAGITLVCPLDFIIDCEQDISFNCVGDMTFDAVNVSADSSFIFKNSNGSFVSNMSLDGTFTANNVSVSLTGAFNLGDPTVDGSWRLIRSGNDLKFERLESAAWVEKGSFAA